MSVIKKNGNSLPAFPSLCDDLFTREFFNWGSRNFTPFRTSVPAKDIKERAREFKADGSGRVPLTKMGSYN